MKILNDEWTGIQVAPYVVGAILALAAAHATAADRTWAAGGADDNWSTLDNWTGANPPATNDGVVFANAGLGRTNAVDQDRQVSALSYSNSSLTQGHLTDLTGHTLIITNFLRAGYNASNCTAILSNGILQLGTSNRTAALTVGYNGETNVVFYSNIWLKIASSLNITNLGDVRVSYAGSKNVQGESNRCVAVLDLSEAVIDSPLGSNTFKAGILRVGGYHSTGKLILPPQLTAIELGQMWVPSDTHNDQHGILDFGANPQLQTFRVRNGFHLASGGAGFLVGWPTNVDVYIGSPTNYVVMGVGEQNGYGLARGTFAMTNGSLTAYLSDLNVGKVGTFHTPHGYLDLSGTQVQIGDEINKIKVGNLVIGGGGGSNPNHYGTLKLPPEITDIICATNELGRGYNYNATNVIATLDLGANTCLTNFVVSNTFYLAEGARTLIYGLPTSNWNLTIGTPEKPASFRVASRSQSDSSVIFSPTGCVFTAYLSEFPIADNASAVYGKPSATVDLQRVTVNALVVTGNVTIAADAVSVSNKNARGTLYLPDCDASFGNLYVGNAWTSPAPASAGRLDLSGTRLSVTNLLRIGLTGIVSNHVSGVSGGLDLLSENTNDFQIAATNGGVSVSFEANPSAQPGDRYYWGLRMAGDQRAYFQDLVNNARIRIGTSGLSPALASRAGVYYNARDNKTYIGLPPLSGTLLLIR